MENRTSPAPPSRPPTGIAPVLRVRPIRACERARWDALVEAHHPLHHARLVGEQLRQVAIDRLGRWVALIGWSAGCRRIASRDRWIGWCEGQRATRLHLIAGNTRLVVVDRTADPVRIGAEALRLAMGRLAADWSARYRHPVLVAEAFADPRQLRPSPSSCHTHAGFAACGRTRGFRRRRQGFIRHGIGRLVLVCELRPEARTQLRAVTTPWDRRHAAGPARSWVYDLPASLDPQVGLIPRLASTVPDPRPGGQYGWSCILGGLLGGLLAGAGTVEEIASWARGLPVATIRRLGGRFRNGSWAMPVANTYREALEQVDPVRVDRVIGDWLGGLGLPVLPPHAGEAPLERWRTAVIAGAARCRESSVVRSATAVCRSAIARA